MLKVLIVDDEAVIRRGLRNVICWEEHGFNICGEAANGKDALDKVSELKPDLIIVDLRMPSIDGLDLIERLRAQGDQLRIIVLTGYSEFEYARRSIDLGVDAYLLKPIEEQELIEKLATIKGKIENDKKNTVESDALEAASDYILQKLLTSNVDQSHILSYSGWYSLGFPWLSYQIVLVSMSCNDYYNDTEGIKSIVCDFVQSGNYGFAFQMESFICILVRNTVFSSNNLACLISLERKLREKYAVEHAIYAGKPVHDMMLLHESYNSALGLQEKRFTFCSSGILCYDMMFGLKEAKPVSDSLKPGKLEENLGTAVAVRQTEYINDLLESFKDEMIYRGLEEKNIKEEYARLFYLVVGVLIKSRGEGLRDIIQDKRIIEEIFKKASLQSLHGYFKKVLCDISEKICDYKSDDVIQRILVYIGRNYNQKITLSEISRIFGYNNAYLGKIFNSQIGKSFNDYLDHIRIENAKKLLEEGRKVFETAQSVGYCDKDYFYERFKKLVGISPTEYKNSYTK